jgi:maleate isomerase
VAALVQEVAVAGPEAIAIHCTNVRGGHPAPALEAALGIPVLDSVAVSLWGALVVAGADPTPLSVWGGCSRYQGRRTGS